MLTIMKNDLQDAIWKELRAQRPFKNFDEGHYWDLAGDIMADSNHPATRFLSETLRVKLKKHYIK
jgi:hypothetical protein